MSDEKITAEHIKLIMERRTSCLPSELSESALREAGCWERVAVLPESFSERASYLGDMLVQMLKPKNSELRAVVGPITQALSYLLNSASWREGELHDFDLDEIKRKLSRLANAKPKEETK